MMQMLLFGIVFALAYANGANDNFKGVATLYGSETLSFRRSLTIATVATAAGALASTWFASRLARTFSGKGLVPSEVLGDPAFLVTVGGAAALTVLLATRVGMPTSTTHALTGALLGVALVQGGPAVPYTTLVHGFLVPLLVSPVLAVGLAAAAQRALGWVRGGRQDEQGILEAECVCVGTERAPIPVPASPITAYSSALPGGSGRMGYGTAVECATRFEEGTIRVAPRRWLDILHASSAGAVCFARALNDTPKIAALLLAAGASAAEPKLGLVAAAMVLGGLLQSRKVAETMSRRITPMNPSQGLVANLVTTSLVLGASRMGVPVSTTHVSVGSLFGLGAAKGTARWRTIRQILATWVTTLPLAMVLSGVAWFVLSWWRPSA